MEEVISVTVELTINPARQVGARDIPFVGIGAIALFDTPRIPPLNQIEKGINLLESILLSIGGMRENLKSTHPKSNEPPQVVLGDFRMTR